MTSPITADTGPLIGLARAGILGILPKLYPVVEVPPAVVDELRIAEDRPGSRSLREAQAAGWLVTVPLESPEEVTELEQVVDRGEAEAILLAEERGSRFLLLDERRGRALERLADAGYRLSPRLRKEILRLAGE
jgi:predicted nucleic acid-binding protein